MGNKLRLTEKDIKKIVKESVLKCLKETQQQTKAPAVYVGTYGKYNSGSLKGEWVRLTDFANYDEFMNYCHNLHRDERDPEIMFQDKEYIPDIFWSESQIDKRFWDLLNDTKHPLDVKLAVADSCDDVDQYFDVIDNVQVFEGCTNVQDVADILADEMIETSNDINFFKQYFDYEKYARELNIEYRWAETDNAMICIDTH